MLKKSYGKTNYLNNVIIEIQSLENHFIFIIDFWNNFFPFVIHLEHLVHACLHVSLFTMMCI